VTCITGEVQEHISFPYLTNSTGQALFPSTWRKREI